MFKFIKDHTKNSFGAEKYTVACIGKLPICNDFIKINVSSREIVDFYEWMKDGVSHVFRSENISLDKDGLAGQPQYFFLTGVNENNNLIGIIQKSKDKIGRDYPITILVNVKNSEHKSEIAPIIYQEFLFETSKILDTLKTDITINDFSKKVEEIGVGKYIERGKESGYLNNKFFKGTDLSEFLNLVLPEHTTTSAGSFFSCLHRHLVTISRRTSTKVDWGLRLPLSLSGKVNNNFVAAFWLKLCVSILKDDIAHLNYSWSSDSECPKLIIFFKKIPSSYFYCFLLSDESEGLLIDILSESKLYNNHDEIKFYDCSLDDFIKEFSYTNILQDIPV